jgi:hypothetical protein
MEDCRYWSWRLYFVFKSNVNEMSTAVCDDVVVHKHSNVSARVLYDLAIFAAFGKIWFETDLDFLPIIEEFMSIVYLLPNSDRCYTREAADKRSTDSCREIFSRFA